MLGGITCAPSRLVYCCTEVGEGDQVYSEGGSPYTRHRAANSHWGQPPPTRHARQGCAQLVTGRKVAKWAIESTESTFLDKTILLSRGSLENFQIFIQLHPSLVRTGSWCWPIAARRQAASTVGRGGGGGERRRRGREKVADVALRKDMYVWLSDTVYEISIICSRFHASFICCQKFWFVYYGIATIPHRQSTSLTKTAPKSFNWKLVFLVLCLKLYAWVWKKGLC